MSEDNDDTNIGATPQYDQISEQPIAWPKPDTSGDVVTRSYLPDSLDAIIKSED